MVEDLRFDGVDEVPASNSPVGDRVDDTVGDLTKRPLASVGSQRSAKVLLGQDVGRVDAP